MSSYLRLQNYVKIVFFRPEYNVFLLISLSPDSWVRNDLMLDGRHHRVSPQNSGILDASKKYFRCFQEREGEGESSRPHTKYMNAVGQAGTSNVEELT